MSTTSIVDVLTDDADVIAADAVDALRREVPTLLAATPEDALRAGIGRGIRRFATVWREGRSFEPAELRALIAPTLTLHGTIDREDALHALRVIVEVCRRHEARRFAEVGDPVGALAVLRQAEEARRLSTALIDELDVTLHRADVGSGRARARVDAELLALLLDRQAAPAAAVARAREHGLDLTGAWTVAVVDGPDDAELPPGFHTPCPVTHEHVLAARRGRLVVVASRPGIQLTGCDGAVGISHATDPGRFRDAFDEAVAALEVARRRSRPAVFDEVLLELVLLGVRPAGELAGRLLADLDDPDPERTAWLFDTLEAYLDASASVTAAARRLSLHRESFRYRLQQLRERLGDRLDDADGRLALHLAVRAARLEGG